MIAIHLFIQQVPGILVEAVGNHSKDTTSEVSDHLEQHADVDQEVCKAKIHINVTQPNFKQLTSKDSAYLYLLMVLQPEKETKQLF